MDIPLTGEGIGYHIVTVVSLVFFKLAVLFVGYLFAKLGHDLLIKGVSGDFKFRTEFKGAQADLVSASPGLFFILMATILIAVGVLQDKPFETKVTGRIIESGTGQQQRVQPRGTKPELPDQPVKEEKPE